jgi:hypothetical protein
MLSNSPPIVGFGDVLGVKTKHKYRCNAVSIDGEKVEARLNRRAPVIQSKR